MKDQLYTTLFSRTLNSIFIQPGARAFTAIATSFALAAGLLILTPYTLQAQTVFWSDDFEASGSPSSGTRTPELEGGSSNAYFGRAEDNGTNTLFINGNTVSFSDYSNQSGSWFWAGENHDNISGNSQSELQINWSGIDISGYSNIQFLGLFGADDSGNFESDNQVYVEYRINGSGPWVQGLRIEANNNDDWAVDTDNDGDGDSPVLSEGMTQLSFDIPATGTTMELRIRV
ncbi:MAG: hypothetical protein KDC66_24005, partial [Phaeodactylibacter sp.]|nr:hypothetical protein [Phaeodactylibacter sp.]